VDTSKASHFKKTRNAFPATKELESIKETSPNTALLSISPLQFRSAGAGKKKQKTIQLRGTHPSNRMLRSNAYRHKGYTTSSVKQQSSAKSRFQEKKENGIFLRPL